MTNNKQDEALALQLIEDAEHHMQIAHCADCRPEDTINYQHAQTVIAAAAELRRQHQRIAELEAKLAQPVIDKGGAS